MRGGTMLRTLRKLIPRGYKLELDGFLHPRTWQRTMSTQNAQLQPEMLRAAFVTSENDPAKHSEDHIGRYYTLSAEEVKTMLPHGLPARFKLQVMFHLWVKNCKELLPSSYNPERLDQPMEAANWLKNFRITNEKILAQIKTQQKYVWGKRDVTEEGCSLIDLTDKVSVEELTLIHNLRKMVANDWTGGAIVATLSQTGAPSTLRHFYLPHELLGRDGFAALEPFVPIQVRDYTDLEFESCYQYYLERKWLGHEKGKFGYFQSQA
ncbi:hypothetical protein Chor_005109, partial [Crotalus horridus]